MNDLISRQAAIEAAKDMLKYHGKNLTEELINYFSTNAMEQIPAVQIEIIRCRDCKYYFVNNLFGRSQGFCSRMFNIYDHAVATEEDDYCSRAERRDDGYSRDCSKG